MNTKALSVPVWAWVVGYALSVILLIACIFNPGDVIPGQVSGALPSLGHWVATMVPAAIATFWISRALHFGPVIAVLLSAVAVLPGVGIAPAILIFLRLRRIPKAVGSPTEKRV